MSNKILKSFLEQTKDEIVPKSFEQSKEHEKLYGNRYGIGDIERQKDNELKTQALKNIVEYKRLSDYVNIPTQISSQELEQKTEPHPQMKNYDHSLEKDRGKDLGLTSSIDALIEMGTIGSDID